MASSELTVEDVLRSSAADPEDAVIRAAVDVVDRQQHEEPRGEPPRLAMDEDEEDDVEEVLLNDEESNKDGMEETNDSVENESVLEDESLLEASKADDESRLDLEDESKLDDLEDLEQTLDDDDDSKLEAGDDDSSLLQEDSRLDDPLDDQSSMVEDQDSILGEDSNMDELKLEQASKKEKECGKDQEGSKEEEDAEQKLSRGTEPSSKVEESKDSEERQVGRTRLSLAISKAVIKLPRVSKEEEKNDEEAPVVRPKRRGRPPKNSKPNDQPNPPELPKRRRKAVVEEVSEEQIEEKPRRKRGRAPKVDWDALSPEEREQVLEERKQKRREYIKNRRDRMKEEQRKERERLGLPVPKQRKRRKDAKNGVRGPKVLSEEEKRARDEKRRARLEEIRKAKMEKEAKRAERNAALKEARKQRKEEERKQKEAYDKRMQELKASFLDETTRMSGGGEDNLGFAIAEESTSAQNLIRNRLGLGNVELSQLDRMTNVTASSLFEYRWPLEGKNSEHYFLQEQLCEYLGIKSFKRRYPDLQRRKVDGEERDFLVEMQVVNEIQVDLGLTAIPSTQALDIMSNDFYDKYDAYMAVVAERKDRNVRPTSYSTVSVEKTKLNDFVESAAESAMLWNRRMNAERKEKRSAFFDMQTFAIHYPQNNRDIMRVVKGEKVGHYPIALIPGQFTDYFKTYSAKELNCFPLNTALKPTPYHVFKPFSELKERASKTNSKPGIENDGSSESSDNSSSSEDDSSSDDDGDNEIDENEKETTTIRSKESYQPIRAIDAEVPGARCKLCNGDRFRNKFGTPEKLLHCSKCSSSYHPTCLGLHLELLHYVTNYMWECTECKVCSKCHDHSDEDKLLFCDLCDRGYHTYCVGLDSIPIGRWQCFQCTVCISCDLRANPEASPHDPIKWVFEYKASLNGTKVYSHTMCGQCHKQWKRGNFCPECTQVFGVEKVPKAIVDCWVCERQHHLECVGQAVFICAACQRKTLEKCVATTGANVLSSGKNDSESEVSKSASLPIITTTTSTVVITASKSIAKSASVVRPTKRASMETGPMTCDVCLKVYKNRSTLYAHRNRDHGIKASSRTNAV